MKKIIAILILLISITTFGNVSLPSIFGTHMVLQQNSEVKLWGWGDPNEKITITTSWGEEFNLTVDYWAKWEVTLHTPNAGETHTITLQGYNKVVIEDILLGEVWLCSGQSNMQWTASSGIVDKEKHIENANYPEIRFFYIPKMVADNPQLNVVGEWKVCSPETMQYFSAVGYFFGEKLHTELNVPVGLISSSWGGSPAEPWTPKEAIEANEIVFAAAKKLKKEPWAPYESAMLYNAMIAPIIPFKIAGTIWYQGETNVQNAATYSELLSTLVTSWRNKWNDDFSFYYVQIAPWKYGDDHFNGVILRDQQRRAASKIENSGVVVISDIGNEDDLHPKNKYPVGVRLANLALNKTYGKTDIQYSGPSYKSFEIEKNKVIISFDFAEGLTSPDKKVPYFEIAGSDGTFYAADAKIVGTTIIVKSKEVKEPTQIRYAWKNAITPALTNNAGLPTSSFTTE